MFPTLKTLLPAKLRRSIRQSFVSHSVTHISGPKRLLLVHNEAVVTCVVKNGEFYLENFIRHYLHMGFRHIFFLDNGSTDRTISIAQQYPNVSVCASHLSIDSHQAHFKKYLAQTSSEGGWCLDADIDEFFDYPFSDQISLRDFLEYLNSQRSTAVITQMLDMFSDQPLGSLSAAPEKDLKGVYQHYDLSNATRTGYQDASFVARFGHSNEVTHDKASLYFGGIRKTLYGNNCLLTKHSLFVPGQVEPFPHVHFVNHARLADVSCVLLHYKLTGNALQTAVQNREGFVGISQGYSDFINLLTSHPDVRIKKDTAARLRSVNDLLANDFLFMSANYEQYVRGKTADTAPCNALLSSSR
jgi:hypothetical protein